MVEGVFEGASRARRECVDGAFDGAFDGALRAFDGALRARLTARRGHIEGMHLRC